MLLLADRELDHAFGQQSGGAEAQAVVGDQLVVDPYGARLDVAAGLAVRAGQVGLNQRVQQADAIGEVKIGQTVIFQVNGYGPQEFRGRVKRINPSANAATRQVEVMVEFATDKQPRLAGLYAEGRVETSRKTALMMPALALSREGDKVFAWRLQDAAVHKVGLTLGERDPRRGDFVVLAGVREGDQLIRNPGSALKEGQKVEIRAAAAIAPIGAASGADK